MGDLVKRLRSVPPCNGCGEYPGGDIAQIMDIAADRIAALEAQVKAADALAEAVTHEREMVCQDFGMQQDAATAVHNALAAYRAAKEGGV